MVRDSLSDTTCRDEAPESGPIWALYPLRILSSLKSTRSAFLVRDVKRTTEFEQEGEHPDESTSFRTGQRFRILSLGGGEPVDLPIERFSYPD
jgi:hypothetical protein